MATLKNRAGQSCATTGTGAISLGLALPAGTAPNAASWQTFSNAGVLDGQSVRYLILDSNGAWEYGPGTFTAAGATLTRAVGAMDGTIPGQKSSTNNLLNLSGNAQVFITAVAEDIISPRGTITVGQIARWASAQEIESVALATAGIQAADPQLDALAALAGGADQLPYFTSATAMAQTTLSAFARDLLDDADAATMRATIGAGTGNVSNTGTPVANTVAIWTAATTIKHDVNLSWNGTSLGIGGAVVAQSASIGLPTGNLQFSYSAPFLNINLAGTDADGFLQFTSKGTGNVDFYTQNFARNQFVVENIASGNIYVGLHGGVGLSDNIHLSDSSPIGIYNANLTGTPVAVTPTAGDSSTKVATTAFANALARTPMQAVASNYNVVVGDMGKLFLLQGTTAFTLGHTVTAASAGLGFRYRVKNMSNVSVTIDPADSELIFSELPGKAATATLLCLAGQEFDVVCDGSSWHAVGRQGNMLLDSYTLSGAAFFDVILPPDYRSFEIRLNNILSATAFALMWYASFDGTTFANTDYYTGFAYSPGNSSNTTAGASESLNSASGQVGGGSFASHGISFIVQVSPGFGGGLNYPRLNVLSGALISGGADQQILMSTSMQASAARMKLIRFASHDGSSLTGDVSITGIM